MRIFYDPFDVIMLNLPSQRNFNLNLDFLGTDNFKRFISSNLIKFIPAAHLENFKLIKEISDKIQIKTKVIMTANAHFANEVFKVWLAEQKLLNKKLIISEHGGAIRSKFSMFDHEESISDKKIVWGIPRSIKHIRLPPNKINEDFFLGKYRKKILIIGLETTLYSYRCQSGPMSSLILDDFHQKVSFIDKLKKVFKGI